MFGARGLTGWHLLILVVVILLLFGAQRLPALAKSVGQSLKIFKSEVQDLTADGKPETKTEGASSDDAPKA